MVHLESDLALLTLSNDLGVKPQTHASNHYISNAYIIWGYPRDVAKMRGDQIQLSRLLNKNPTLHDILKDGDELETELKDQGYPLPSVRILSLSSTIQPGHSGAPILDRNKRVIGIADGGLYDGFAGINWAIHSDYLPKLIREGIGPSDREFPRRSSKQKALMASQYPSNSKIVAENKDGNRLYFVRTQRLGDIYDDLSQSDQQDLDSPTRSFKSNWRDHLIDVYEDTYTGATIAVPSGAIAGYNVDKDWFEIKNENIFEMIIQASNNSNWPNALTKKDAFIDELSKLKEWDEGPTGGPDIMDEEFSHLSGNRGWETSHENGSQKGQMSANLQIDNNNFFGLAYLTHDVQKMEDFDKYYLLNVCLRLTRFAKH